MEIGPEGMRKIEEQVKAETSMRFQQALDGLTAPICSVVATPIARPTPWRRS